MAAGLNSGGMIPVFPESTLSFLTSVEFSSGSPGDKLDRFRNGVPFSVKNKQMDVI
jgi:hypothetical protein